MPSSALAFLFSTVPRCWCFVLLCLVPFRAVCAGMRSGSCVQPLRAFRLSVGGIPGAQTQGAVILLQLDTLGITKLKIV